MIGGSVFKKLREPVNGLTHLGAACAALLGLALLLYLGRGNLVRQASLLLYGCSLILMFSASAAYHLIRSGPRGARFLRQLDHASIYFLIAGTYTPICLYFFTGFWRWGILTIIWLMALVGIAVKVFTINAPRWLSAGIYLVMGWLSIMGIRVILAAMPAWALVWLVLGGVFFTVGAVIYMTKWPDFFPGIFGFHELWHIFVILGCLSHFILIAVFVAPHAALA
jgi:hemolysin III